MPAAAEARRGGATRYRTIRVGTGASRRYIHVAIVRRRGKRGGRTVAGPPHTYRKASG